jgi:hypothetical protein
LKYSRKESVISCLPQDLDVAAPPRKDMAEAETSFDPYLLRLLAISWGVAEGKYTEVSHIPNYKSMQLLES